MKILFLNHKIQNCGVYQYGYRVYNILKNSLVHYYIYKELDSETEYLNYIIENEPDLVLYNYHSSTMNWLNSGNIQKKVKNVGIPHESESAIFDCILNIDPNGIETDNIYSIPRPIYESVEEIIANLEIKNNNIKNFIEYKESDIPVFGSFGFGFNNKGFDKIVNLITANYEVAIIKLVITLAHFDPNSAVVPNQITQLCQSLSTNPNIKIMISNDFFSNEELLLFLQSNTANIFLYDKMPGRGISSVIDYAMSVKRPFVISDSYMFRHIYSDSICVYKTNIHEAIENSQKLLPKFIAINSNHKLIGKTDNIFNNFSKYS